MHPVAVFDFISLLAAIAALIILFRSWYQPLKWDVKLMLISLLVFTLVYDFCLMLEWTGINLNLDPFEDIVGALLPMWWAFIFYAFLQQTAFSDLRQSEQKNATMAEIGRIINSSLDIEDVYERFAEEVKKLISFDRISINLINSQNNTTTIAYVTGIDLPSRLKGDIVPLDGTLTEKIVQSRKSILIQADELKDYSKRLPRLLPSFQTGFRSLISAPLISKDTVIGVLHFRTTTANIYSEKELRLAERVGDQIASAISNSQLFIEHIRSLEALQESEERYRDLVENAVTGFYQVEKKGKFLLVNQKMAEMFGFDSPQQFLHEVDNITKIYANPKIRPEILKEIDEKGFVQGHEVEFKTKDEKNIWVKVNTRTRTNKDGMVMYEGVMEDITQRKQLENQLQHAQKMEAIGTLAGGTAHDFNNLLMAVQGNASLVLSHLDDTHPHYEKIKKIEKLVKSGAKLTGQLLGYARKGKYEVRPIDFNHIVEETADTFSSARKEIQIHKALSADLFAVEADQGQIEQVLLNLYLNAADAMGGDGKLFIATENIFDTDIKDKPYDPKPGNYVSLKVSDTGTGMDKETIERIFEPFFTTKKMGRGTGLGLASAYGIIKAHGGYIDVESKKGRGTTFRIYLPALGIRVDRKLEESGQSIKGNEAVLFVDDEEVVLEVSSLMLQYLGYSVYEAKGGKEALKIYEDNKDQIDLVVLDMIMPDMGGSDTYDSLKEINSDVKVLLSSGFSLDGQAEDILKRGCNGFIQKPFNLIELSQKIKEVLD